MDSRGIPSKQPADARKGGESRGQPGGGGPGGGRLLFPCGERCRDSSSLYVAEIIALRMDSSFQTAAASRCRFISPVSKVPAGEHESTLRSDGNRAVVLTRTSGNTDLQRRLPRRSSAAPAALLKGNSVSCGHVRPSRRLMPAWGRSPETRLQCDRRSGLRYNCQCTGNDRLQKNECHTRKIL